MLHEHVRVLYIISDYMMNQVLTTTGEVRQSPDVAEELLSWLSEGSNDLPVRECQAAEFDQNSMKVQSFSEPVIHNDSTGVQVSRLSWIDTSFEEEFIFG